MNSPSITSRYFVPTGTIWPSGDFSLGARCIDRRGPYSRDRRSMQRAYDDSQNGRWTLEAQEQREAFSVPGAMALALEAEECYQNPAFYEEGEGTDLTLANGRNPHRISSRPEKYGKLGITGYGRKMVKSTAILIQKMPNKRTTFATVTMPELPQQLRRELAQCWPEFVRQLLQRLSRWLLKSGLPPLVCSVSEIQPKRLAESGAGYLHLHLVWPNHWAKSGNWAIDVDALRAWCSEFLQSRGLWLSDSWVRVNVQRVKKTAAGYLAKYMSKGSEELKQFAKDCGWDSVPGQWWNLTKKARDLVKKYTRRGDDVGTLLDSLIVHGQNNPEFWGFYSLHPVLREADDRVVHCGWFGAMRPELRKDLLSWLDKGRTASYKLEG